MKNNYKNKRIGDSKLNKQGLKMEIIDYVNARYLNVQFDDGTIVKNRTYQAFKKGNILNPNSDILKKTYNNRLGEKTITKDGELIEIVEYNNANNIKVKFCSNDLIVNCTYASFKNKSLINPNKYEERKKLIYTTNENELVKIIDYYDNKNLVIEFQDKYKYRMSVSYSVLNTGRIKNPYHKSIYGIGYLGEMYKNYNCLKKLNSYKYWVSMFTRCYSKKYQEKNPSYKDCEVCEEWHNFTIFNEWFNKNYYEIEGEKIELDKDILIYNNNLYSPNSCLFLPKRINNMICNFKNKNEKLKGVYYTERDKNYAVYCRNIDGINTYLGKFNTQYEGFLAYKNFKESEIYKIANKYKNDIPFHVYNAILEYKVRSE